MKLEVVHQEEVWFKPFQNDAFEIGLYKGHFGIVLSKCLRVIMNVELALYQENLEFVEVSPIKLIQFSDFGALQSVEGMVI